MVGSFLGTSTDRTLVIVVSFGANCVPEELVCRAGWTADRPFVREAAGMGTTKAWSVGRMVG